MKRLLVASIFLSFSLKILAINTYSIIKLPPDFYVVGGAKGTLNNSGQVGGVFSPNTKAAYEQHQKKPSDPNFDPYEGAKAAYWDSVRGMVTIAMPAYKSLGCSINDNGLIAVALYADKKPHRQEESRALTWNTKNNLIKLGPIGIPEAINKEGYAFIKVNDFKQGHHSLIWDSTDDTYQYTKTMNPKSDLLNSFTTNSKNTHGTHAFIVPSSTGEIELKLGDNKYKLLLPCNGILKGKWYLNNNDEVVSISVVKDNKKENSDKSIINKWKGDGSVTCSDELQKMSELSDYNCFSIIEFNDVGQILITASTSKVPTRDICSDEYNTFLLTPLNQ